MTKEESKKMDAIMAEVKKLSKLLLGNGGVGLFERVRALEKTRRLFFRLPNNILILVNILMAIFLILNFFKR